MVEDWQEEYVQNKDHYRNDEPNRRGMFLVAFILWVIFATVMIITARPKIIKTLEETNAVEVFKNRKELRQKNISTEVVLYFANLKDNSKYTLTGFKTDVVQTGESKLHDAVEGLLKGPTDAVLKHGAVTMIPKGTSLNGLTVSNKIAFVDLSSEFTADGNSDYKGAARWQILKTLQAVDSSITRLIILIDGEEI